MHARRSPERIHLQSRIVGKAIHNPFTLTVSGKAIRNPGTLAVSGKALRLCITPVTHS